jgi:thiol:disulfide interchange protein DsbD
MLFIGGLLASLLPCVYPLYPITATIVRDRGAGGPVWLHPLAYYLGVAFIYSIFGVIASLTGGAFNQVLRFGATNIAIAVVLALLGLTTMGLLHLPFFTPRKLPVGAGVLGTFMMGLSAGLLSSACVGPVVVSVLIGLAAGATGFSPAVTLAAACKMFSFGLGVGLPFLAIGLFGMSLPKSGHWMQKVQVALGLLILYFAFVYLQKGLGVMGFSETSILWIGLALPLLLVCGFCIQDAKVDKYQRTQRALWGLGLVIAAGMICRGMAPAAPTLAAVASAASCSTETVEVDGNLTWCLDRELAYRKAKEQGRKVFVDFSASWCANCKEFARIAREDAEFNKALSKAVLLKVNESTPLFATYEKDSRFLELRIGLPFFIVTDAEGNLIYKTSDYLKTEEMAMFLED